MKTTDIQIELRNYKIRQGFLYKRSRIVREWRKRWIVLTMNFLFSFQTEKCQKPTQIIDLKEVIGLKSSLKKTEDIFTNCFFIQTKSTDFAIAAKETIQKWSWMVTFQRLFDFKERGASFYNSIDLIKKEGFESQQEFEYRRKNHAKTDLQITKTKSFEEECKKKEEKADQILQHLIEQQAKLNEKQQKLLLLENQLKKQAIFLSEKKQIQQAQLNFKEKKVANMSRLSKEQGLQGKHSLTLPQGELKQKNGHFQMSQSMRFVRAKCIQYIFDQFHSTQNREELLIIIQFLLCLAEKEHFNFRIMLAYQTHNHKYLKNFIACLLSYAQSNTNLSLSDIKRFVVFFGVCFEGNNMVQPHINDHILQIISKWTLFFAAQTQLQLLIDYVKLTLSLIKQTQASDRQKLISKLQYLVELSQDSQYRQLCKQALLLLTN